MCQAAEKAKECSKGMKEWLKKYERRVGRKKGERSQKFRFIGHAACSFDDCRFAAGHMVRVHGLQGEYAKCLMLLVKELVLPSQINAVG
nr:hypothetical protein [Tanacetum cinerariifolium]